MTHSAIAGFRVAALGLSLLVASAAMAQTADTTDSTASGKAEKLQEAKAKFDERFASADADHDGKLTPAEAKAGMPMVSKNFQAIDTNGDGFVTKPEILAFMQSRMAARKAAAASTPSP
jgi:Ca2+-binding EF-hand superfamily protein